MAFENYKWQHYLTRYMVWYLCWTYSYPLCHTKTLAISTFMPQVEVHTDALKLQRIIHTINTCFFNKQVIYILYNLSYLWYLAALCMQQYYILFKYLHVYTSAHTWCTSSLIRFLSSLDYYTQKYFWCMTYLSMMNHHKPLRLI